MLFNMKTKRVKSKGNILMGSVSVKNDVGQIITLVFSNLQEGEWILRDASNPVIKVWMNDESNLFTKSAFPDEESWDMVLQCTGLEDS